MANRSRVTGALLALAVVAGCGGDGDGGPGDGDCQPGQSRCTSDGLGVEVCSADGSGYELSEECAPGTCEAGACTTTCSDGDTRCNSDYDAQEVCNGGQWQEVACDTNLCQAGECARTSELEPPDVKGENDLFDDAEPVPFATDFTAHIGQEGDVDQFVFEVNEPGIVHISLDFSPSYQGLDIFNMVAATRTDAFLVSATSVGLSSPEAFECHDYETTVICDSSFEVDQSVASEVGRYTIEVKGYGNPVYGIPGYDSVNPYVLRVDFSPGPTLESDQPLVEGFEVSENDSWRTAREIDLQVGEPFQIASYGFYWNDWDWYKFTAEQDGWLRIVTDVTSAEEFNENAIDLWLGGQLLVQTGDEVVPTSLDFFGHGYAQLPGRSRRVPGHRGRQDLLHQDPQLRVVARASLRPAAGAGPGTPRGRPGRRGAGHHVAARRIRVGHPRPGQ